MSHEDQKSYPAREMVKSAAVMYAGKIFVGHDHVDALEALQKEHPGCFNVDTGFLTTHNRFLSRKEALEIAESEGQFRGGFDAVDEMYSEGRGLVSHCLD